ncbi:oligosaccharide repeat unit polymerase [Clostridium sp. Sa3CUN1]|uniref:Oligosaccharide repeat unit polymerase n=1 Tax=Clostridium gallinarum TaxID=2762246 RepID=A0ABR8Q5F9_9CLOT|nr:O-antigen polymerase [Clostridium gallinarum]MBD7915656.1 oligosaccharide repeat unit polymerase [Clostridium gallinarum]
MKDRKEFLLKLFLFIIMIDRIYLPSYARTGEYNNIIFPMIALSIGWYAFYRIKVFSIKKLSVVYLIILGMIINYTFLGGDIKELIRYILVILISLFLLEIEEINLRKYFIATIILGTLFSTYDFFMNIDRSTGFLRTSPTIYSLIILIAIVYFLYAGKCKIFEKVLCGLGVFAIFTTGSRSTLIAAIIFIVAKFIMGMRVKNNKLIIKWIISVLSIILLVLIFSFSEINITNYKIRENANQSNETRFGFIMKVFDKMNNDKISYIVGLGPGASYNIIDSNKGVKVPIHQDIISILCDFGIIGIVFLYILLSIGKYKLTWQGKILLIVGSFHNLIFYPIGIILIYLTSISIRKNISK